MDRFAGLTGRQYRLFDYDGAADAERVVVLMGSGAETARATADGVARARREGRRAAGAAVPSVLRGASAGGAARDVPRRSPCWSRPRSRAHRASRCISTWSTRWRRPCRAASARRCRGSSAAATGCRRRISPRRMAKAVFDELREAGAAATASPSASTTMSRTPACESIRRSDRAGRSVRAVFYGLGADGTVGANKNSVKIIAEDAGRYAQGYFVYDSHKSGAQTISHLRFGPRADPRALSDRSGPASLACHSSSSSSGRTCCGWRRRARLFLLNSPYGPDEIWDQLPRSVQQQIIDKELRFFVIDASRVAREVGLGGRTNTMLQTCFFAISGVLPREKAIAPHQGSDPEDLRRQGRGGGEGEFRRGGCHAGAAVRGAVPATATGGFDRPPIVPGRAGIRPPGDRPDVRRLGDEIPVSLMPADGTFPSGTAIWRSAISLKRSRCGRPNCASSAANAASSARTA